MLEGNVLITGGAGFLGRGIMRQAQRENWPVHFTVLSRDEDKQARARVQYPDAAYVLGDVLDMRRLADVMVGHQTVIHAAALKFIPEGEHNVDEVVRVNIDGARNILVCAPAAGVKRVVGISTDKAAQPVNVYGMTKAIMERLFAEAGDCHGTVFTTCRYGNVIGSTGSVVPVMRAQFEAKSRVNVTDLNMTRFWMSVGQAVDTVVRAASATPGSVTIPDPQAATMLDIARAVLRLYNADEDPPPIRVVGRRPGEKQHEDLISHYELFRSTRDGDYYTILPPGNENYALDFPTLSSDCARRLDVGLLATLMAEAGTV